MKLSEYIKYLKELEKQGHGNKEVIYAIDDEGNDYHPVYYKPSISEYGKVIIN